MEKCTLVVLLLRSYVLELKAAAAVEAAKEFWLLICVHFWCFTALNVNHGRVIEMLR